MVRALIMEDDDEVRSMVRMYLELAGVEVVALAADAPAAVACWDELRPDVVVLDHYVSCHAGDLTGLDAAAAIRSIDPNANLVLFSAWADAGPVEARAADLGVRCVTKDRLAGLVDALSLAA